MGSVDQSAGNAGERPAASGAALPFSRLRGEGHTLACVEGALNAIDEALEDTTSVYVEACLSDALKSLVLALRRMREGV